VIHDRVLDSYVQQFAKDYDLTSLGEDRVFEHFANLTVASKVSGQRIDPLDATTGANAYGVDGIAILVNDQLVLDPDEVTDLKRNRLDAHFIFVQAKAANKFDVGEILKFADAVKSFFADQGSINDTEQVNRFKDIRKEIYSNTIKMEIAPACDLFYVSCGKWQAEPQLVGAMTRARDDLQATGLFSEVKFTPVDAEKLKSYFRALKHQIVRQITFEKFAVLPRMQNVDQAYIGVLPASEYLKLIVDADGNLERNLFYENVRDYQGDNAVNTEISESVRANQAIQDKFAILNNGITIVAREIRPIGSEFTLHDYQVVNGCQTSHVLYFNRAFVTKDLHVPIKLIATSSSEVTGLVIKATNRQTEVKQEAFATLEPFHKRLEEFFASISDPTIRLFYERRSGQYDRDNIAPNRIISIAVQTKAFVAMLSGEPHNAHHYYGELLKTYWQSKGEMYQESHDPWPYFICALSYVELDKLLRENRQKYRAYRHHLLGLLGRQFFGERPSEVFRLGSKAIKEKAERAITFWKDRSLASKQVEELLEIVDSCYRTVGRGEHPWDAAQRRDFTDELQNQYNRRFAVQRTAPAPDHSALVRGRGAPVSAPRSMGKIKRVGPEFGFISDDSGQDYFFHRSAILRNDSITVGPGTSVQFTPVLAPRGLKAVDVTVLS